MTKGKCDLPKAPPHLRKAGKELWVTILTEFRLPGDALPVSALSCQAADRFDEARKAIDMDGVSFINRFG